MSNVHERSYFNEQRSLMKEKKKTIDSSGRIYFQFKVMSTIRFFFCLIICPEFNTWHNSMIVQPFFFLNIRPVSNELPAQFVHCRSIHCNCCSMMDFEGHFLRLYFDVFQPSVGFFVEHRANHLLFNRPKITQTQGF